MDNIDDLASDLAWIDSNWERVVHSVTGAVVLILPKVPNHPPGSAEARAAEDAWEERALAMHSAQVPIHLKPKPTENALSKIERGD